jgi:glycosyltransferase involved in cell wall biosynthesis
MSLGTVTIIVPTYKRPEKVRRAIQSILAQTYRDVRVLVFDNASSDGTREAIAELAAKDPRIEYHCHSENIGIIENLNFAYNRVTTPFFGLLTDDDYYLPGFIEDAMQAFQRHPGVQLSFLSAPTVQEDGTFISDQLVGWPREGAFAAGESILSAVKGHHPILTMCIFRLALLPELNFGRTTSCIADIPILISVLAKYPFCLSKKPGGYFIRHKQAAGNQFAKIQNIENICLAWFAVEERFRKDTVIAPECRGKILAGLRQRVDRILLGLMVESVTENNRTALRYAHDRLRERRPSILWLWGNLVWLTSGIVSLNILAEVVRIMRKAKSGLQKVSIIN